MSHQENSSDAAGNTAAAESSLGQALAAIHRALAQIDEPARAASVQSYLHKAVSLIDSARSSHARATGGAEASQGAAAPEIVAAIAAAISTVLASPYRLVSLQKVAVPVPQQTAWATEGRAQIFRSHKVR
jgi:hypothetical protein